MTDQELRTTLERMSKDELNLLGKKFNIPAYRRLKKSELVDKLLPVPDLAKNLNLTFWDRHHNHVYGAVTILSLLLAIAFFLWPESRVTLSPPQLSTIGTFEISKSDPNVAFAFPKIDLINVCNLPVGISNPNEADLENLEVTFQIDNKYACVLPESYSDRKEFFRVNPSASTRTTIAGPDGTSSTNHYESIGANVNHVIMEPIVFLSLIHI